MCGIIGRISLISDPKKSIMGLKELEYRGYDSFGLLYSNPKNGFTLLEKDVGELDVEKIEIDSIESLIEIGHTRWATHGSVTKENAHPHFDEKEEFFVVMNGIVENHEELRKELMEMGCSFVSETDTEIIPIAYSCLFEDFGDDEKSLIETTKKVLEKLKGEFSFILKYKNYLLGYKNINPLVFGISDGELFASSDLNLVQKYTDEFYVLEDKELFISQLNDDCVKHVIFDENFEIVERERKKSVKSFEDTSKNTQYYMEKEILEQEHISKFLTKENIENIESIIDEIKHKNIVISAAGSSYHASLYLHYKLLENGLMSQVILASELKNYTSLIKNSAIIVFSQSGETADLIYPLKNIDQSNSIFTITNTANSTLDRFAKKSVYLNCGKEIAVASTKAFVNQIFAAEVIGSILSDKKINTLGYEKNFIDVIEKNNETIDEICLEYKRAKSFFYLGRNQYFPLALEGALKLKEISYLHAEGFAGGELKHGPLALIEKGVPVVILGGDDEILSNAIEIKTRGGVIIGINSKNHDVYDYYLEVPDEFKEIYSTILMQIISLKITLILGHNPDKPRNLAKSVTVK